MSLKRRRSKFAERDEADPMSGVVNMVDLMLVLAVGFMVFAIMAMGAQSVISQHSTPSQQSQSQSSVDVSQGQQLSESPQSASSSGSGYTEMGKVYKDPQSGKMVMVTK